jgi:SSS family solute:Na+ symporter
MLRAHFLPIDWLIPGLYLLFLLVAGFWPRKQDTETYLIADRDLGLPIFVATLVATWYGGVLGVGEFVYTSGVVSWTANSLPYYVMAFVFALFLARRVRQGSTSNYTIADKLEQEYDRKTALLGALATFIYASPSAYVLMAGILLQMLFGWHILPAILAGTFFSLVYVFRGGFLSDVRVNTVQFLLMFTGFAAALYVCLTHFGLHTILARHALPLDALMFLGNPHAGQGAGYVIVWFFIALVTFTDPTFHQRCYAARTPGVAVKGILIAIVCWFIFDVMSTTTGLFARVLLPHLNDATYAYPELAERIMPPGLKGLFYTGMLAPVMASLVSYTFVSALTVGRDFIWRMKNEPNSDSVPRYTRWGLVATAILAVIVALLVPSVVEQWYAFGNVFVPAMLLPLIGAYAKDKRLKPSPNFAFAAMLAGGSVALACLLDGWMHGGMDNPAFPLGWQPMYSGLLVCGAIYLAGLLVRTRKTQGTVTD